MRRISAAAAALCFLSAGVLAQESPQVLRTTKFNAPPKPSGSTPRTADGHPDLTGVWNGRGDNLNGVPNQIANNGIVIETDSSARDLHSGSLRQLRASLFVRRARLLSLLFQLALPKA